MIVYFAMNKINFGIILVAILFIILRYSHFNDRVLGPYCEKSPLIKDLYDLIDRFSVKKNDDKYQDDAYEYEYNYDIEEGYNDGGNDGDGGNGGGNDGVGGEMVEEGGEDRGGERELFQVPVAQNAELDQIFSTLDSKIGSISEID